MGWCPSHYQRARSHDGDPLAGRTSRGDALAFYLAHVDDDTDECIVWPYDLHCFGYGRLRVDGQMRHVHILACEHHYGPMPMPDMYAVHAPVICHNPSCFNWRHLSWGTPKDNSADQILDGTDTSGERRYNAKLTWVQVGEIRSRRAAGELAKVLATEYEISLGHVYGITAGLKWKRAQSH